MGKYSEDPTWADIVPLPTDEGGPHPLASIAYSDEYEEVSSYMRAIMAKTEFSDRALQLTEDLIDMNTAHYTAWLYRAQCLLALKKDLRAEIDWLNETALAHLKNYQIWHHRNLIVDELDSADGETEFIEKILQLDAKNYHVWSYRQWLVKRFGLWEQGELDFVERMLALDVRNNSAWNHRWYIVNGRGQPGQVIHDREIDYAKAAIKKAPQNQSPWYYLRAVAKQAGMDLAALETFAVEYAHVESDTVKSSHALDLLVDIWTERKTTKQASKALDLLADKYDPIRKNFWEYKRGLLMTA